MKRRKRVRLINKKRFLTVILVFILVLGLSLTSIIYASTNESTVESFKLITVRAGDTLWSISKIHSPGNIDIREYIYKIEKLNNIKNAFIAEGDTLKVPIIN